MNGLRLVLLLYALPVSDDLTELAAVRAMELRKARSHNQVLLYRMWVVRSIRKNDSVLPSDQDEVHMQTKPSILHIRAKRISLTFP